MHDIVLAVTMLVCTVGVGNGRYNSVRFINTSV